MIKTFYSFNFIPEGFNMVWAETEREAISKAQAEFPELALNLKSFVRRDTQEKQYAYWNSLPLMD